MGLTLYVSTGGQHVRIIHSSNVSCVKQATNLFRFLYQEMCSGAYEVLAAELTIELNSILEDDLLEPLDVLAALDNVCKRWTRRRVGAEEL